MVKKNVAEAIQEQKRISVRIIEENIESDVKNNCSCFVKQALRMYINENREKVCTYLTKNIVW